MSGRLEIRFRDTYQSAAYWSVIRILEAKDDSIEKSICDYSAPVATFRIGNSEPLQVAGDKPLGTENQKNALSIAERNLIAINGSLETIFRPIIQGVSPFWPMLIQCVVIGLASIALLHDIPERFVHAELGISWQKAYWFIRVHHRLEQLKAQLPGVEDLPSEEGHMRLLDKVPDELLGAQWSRVVQRAREKGEGINMAFIKRVVQEENVVREYGEYLEVAPADAQATGNAESYRDPDPSPGRR